MNYLAHLLLSDPEPESLIGSLMGDFVKGQVDDGLAPALRHGILLHRRIDAFTDAHPVVRDSKRRISADFRRYAGILVDVFYDHFLARRWDRYARLPLETFARDVYALLHAHHASLPPRMQRSMAYMRSNDLLVSYRDIDGIRHALRGLETRLKRPSRLGDAVVELEREYSALGDDFERFFPQLQVFVRDEGGSRNID